MAGPTELFITTPLDSPKRLTRISGLATPTDEPLFKVGSLASEIYLV